MFDLSWTETAVILLVASLVIGPEELPGLVKAARHMAGRLRQAARRWMEDMEQAAGVQEMRQELRELNQDVRYITDEHGAVYEAYSLDDIRPHLARSRHDAEHAPAGGAENTP